MVFPCLVRIHTDTSIDWLETELSYAEVIEEVMTYSLDKNPERSVVKFWAYPFLDDYELCFYHLYFYPPSYGDSILFREENKDLMGISITILQSFVG